MTAKSRTVNARRKAISWWLKLRLRTSLAHSLHQSSRDNQCHTMCTHIQVSQCCHTSRAISSTRWSKRATWTGTRNCKIEMRVHLGYTLTSKSLSSTAQNSFTSNNKHSREELQTCRLMPMSTIICSSLCKRQTPSLMSCSDLTTIDDDSLTMFYTHLICGRTSLDRSVRLVESEQL